jgi:hypothetical protein
MISLLITPITAVDFPTSKHIENELTLYARTSAETPWQSPFTENVTLTLSIEIPDEIIAWINISSVLLSLHAKNPTGSGFALVDAESRSFDTPISGTPYINFTGDFTFESSMTGEECYFAVSVQGTYSNFTYQKQYLVATNESFIGPFLILASLATPQVYVGLLIGIVASVVIVAGMIAVKRNRSISKRRRLLTD